METSKVEQSVTEQVKSWLVDHLPELPAELVFVFRGAAVSEKETSSEIKALWQARLDSLPAGQRGVFSLTHSAGVVAGLGLVVNDNSPLRGLGIDLEKRDRPVSEAALNRFCSESEREYLPVLSPVELWTLKEAAFKSDPGNSGKVVWDYRLRDVRQLNETSVQGYAPGGCLLLRLGEWAFSVCLYLG
jgi:hypothetical protein